MARRARGWRGMLALGVAAASFAVPADAASGRCAVDGAVVTGTDLWTRIAAPGFEDGGDTMTSYTVDELRPDRVFATNGVSIASSTDGGCTWHEASIPDEPLAVADPLGGENGRVAQRRLTDVVVPFGAASTVWSIGLTDVVAGGTPLVEPRVLVSADGGRSFTPRTTGLPRFAKPVALEAASSTLAFLLLEETVPTASRSLWFTADAGARWARVGDAPYDDFVYDLFRNVLWAWTEDALHLSRDGGRTWGSVPVPSAPLRVDVSPAFTTVAFMSGGRYDFVGPDRVVPRPSPEHLTSIAAGPLDGFVVTSSVVDGVTVYPPAATGMAPYELTPDDVTLSDLNLAQTPVAGTQDFLLYGFSPRALYRRVVEPASAPPRRPVEVTVRPPALPPPPKAGLFPAGNVITLKPGERRKVPYDLVLAPTPTPLDVYFMTDSTGSMSDAIAAVQEGVQDIVDDLARAGIDLHFGVADFRDYPQTPGDDVTYPYKQRRKVGKIDDELAEALESISTGGGNGNDSALEAIFQAVTGSGRTGLTASIPSGLDARFRTEALKVVLVASDDEMREPTATEPWNAGPTKQEVIDALVAKGVEVVGIRVNTGGGNPRQQMEDLAEGAGSVAPPNGVDCDGDGESDIDEGEPLVCDFASGQEIAPAFVGMLRGIKDVADVHVGVTGPKDVVRHLGEPTFEDLNVKAQNTLPVPVEFRCTPARYGTDTPVTIEGVLRSRALVTATRTVRCLAPPGVPPAAVVIPPVLPRDPPKPLRAVAAPPPPPPQPVQNVNPNPNPNPQAQAQAGMASQEDQQHQLALAEMDVTEDEELAFSAIDNRNDVTPAVTLVVGALVACAAAGAQLHLARRVRAATNPSRGERR